MKDIRFRVWDKEKNRMSPITALYWDWECKKITTCNTVIERLYSNTQDSNFVIMQYTGITDDKDIPIYEGDILCGYEDFGEGECGCEYLAIVIWDEESCSFQFQDLKYNQIYPMNDYCFNYVIGNIFENKDILENLSF